MITNIISLILSIAAISMTIFVYLKHDRKLKLQEEIINKYQINQITKDIEQSKHAIIKVSVKNKHADFQNNSATLVIKNLGQGAAEKVYITNCRLENWTLGLDEGINCGDLLPNEEYECFMHWQFPYGGYHQFDISWNDGSGQRNHANQEVYI